jgi:hypothetical protein
MTKRATGLAEERVLALHPHPLSSSIGSIGGGLVVKPKEYFPSTVTV